MITDLDVIVEEWAYRVHDGKPNPKNDNHIYVLSNLLYELKWPMVVIDGVIKNLREQENKFKARSKETGKIRYFKDKESMDNALDAGTVEPIEKPDKKKDEPEQDPGKVTDFERPSDTEKKQEPKDKQSKKPSVKTKAFAKDIDKEYINKAVEPSEEEYQKNKPEQLELKDGAEPIKFSGEEKEFLSSNFPKRYIETLERLLNTKRIDDFLPPIGSFVDASGGGRITSTAGEIMTMMSISMTDEQFALLEQKMGEHFTNLGDSVKNQDLILDRDWIESAKAVRAGTYARYDEYYGKGNWEIKGSAWDTKKDVDALGFDYSKKGFSTDAYFRLEVNGEPVLDEISFKKDLNITLSQPSVNSVFQWTLTGEDKKEYDELGEKLKTTKNVKEARAIRQRREELLQKNSDILGDGDPQKAQKAERESARKFLNNLSDEQFNNFTNLTDEKIEELFSRNQDRVYIKGLRDKIKNIDPPMTVEKLQQALNSKDKKKMKKASTLIAKTLGNMGDEEAKQHYKDHIQIVKDMGKAFIENLVKVPEIKNGLMNDIRKKFPLKSLMDGEERMALGGVSADENVMKEIFGTTNYDEIQENLEIQEGKDGKSKLVFKSKTSDKTVVLSELFVRQRGLGYSTTPNFTMNISEELKGELYRANVKLGRDVYDPKEGSRASLSNKYGEE